METTITAPVNDLPLATAEQGESRGDLAASKRHRIFKPQGKSWGEWAAEVLSRADADLRLLLPDNRHADLIGLVEDRMAAANAAALQGKFQAAVQSAWNARMDTLEEVFSRELTETSQSIAPLRGAAAIAPQIEATVAQVDNLMTAACLEADNGRLKAVRLVRQASDIVAFLRKSRLARGFLGEETDVAEPWKKFHGDGNRSKASARGRQPAPSPAPTKAKGGGSGKRQAHGR